MSQYASAAYCPSNTNSPGNRIQCGSGNCPLVEQASSTTVLEYSKYVFAASSSTSLTHTTRIETLTDVTGFIALDHSNKAIIVSFRGSQSIDNWLTNLNFGLVPTDLCARCTAHAGFWQSWVDARDTVIPAVKATAANYADYQIAITGHSLGGAIAPFAAAQLRNQGMRVALYTFGSPRVGGPTLSSYISSQGGGNYRVTHWNDPVPRLPLLTLGYVHISPEYYIGVKNKVDVKAEDVKVYDGAINLLKGNSAWLISDVEAHRWYFTQMYSCADAKQKRGIDVVVSF